LQLFNLNLHANAASSSGDAVVPRILQNEAATELVDAMKNQLTSKLMRDMDELVSYY